MATTLTLEGTGGVLQVKAATNEYGWSYCYLSAGDFIYLGAETVDVLLARLGNAVAEDLPLCSPSDKINGQSARWVLSFAEAHWSLYVAQQGYERVLIWQDDSAKPRAIRIHLSLEQQQQWQVKIKELQARLGSQHLSSYQITTKEIAETVGGAEVLK